MFRSVIAAGLRALKRLASKRLASNRLASKRVRIGFAGRRFSFQDSQAALERADWTTIVTRARDAGRLKASPPWMGLFVRAAGELRDAEALAWAEEQCLEAGWSHRERHSVSRRFLLFGEAASAWRIFTADPAVTAEPDFMRQAKSFLPHARDPALRAEIRAALSGAGYVTAASGPRPAATAIAFPCPDSGRRAQGSVEIRASARTPSHHAGAVARDIARFGRAAARAAPPEIVEYRNVFVDQNGQIWREDGRVLVSQGLPVSGLSRREAPEVETGFFAVKRTRGIYHWLVDRLPLFAWMLADGAPAAEILLADGAPAFERETLGLARLGRPVTDIGEAVFVRRLLVARSGMHGLAYWDRVAPIVERVRDGAHTLGVQANLVPADALYISRRDAQRRSMDNEAGIEARVAARGYRGITLGTIPLWQQVFAVSSARRILAPHGAGLAHILFAPPGTRITEILPIQDGTYRLRLNYARLSLVMGHRYRAWLEPQVGRRDRWEVDEAAFLAFLDGEAREVGAPP